MALQPVHLDDLDPMGMVHNARYAAAFSGAHLMHLAAAGCVLNDVYREAAAPGIQIDGVRVSATGGFDTKAWISTGLTYSVELSSADSAQDLAQLSAQQGASVIWSPTSARLSTGPRLGLRCAFRTPE